MIIFLLKLTIFWGAFALFYEMLLRNETFFRANRAYLLGTAILGAALSLPAGWLPVIQGELAGPGLALPAVTVGLQQAETSVGEWKGAGILRALYLAGAGIALLRVSWGLFRIWRMTLAGAAEGLGDGCLLIRTPEAQVPFSFFKWVFIPAGFQFSDEGAGPAEAMLAHERAHAHGRHSADVLFAELLCVVFWFHPLAHWYRRSLRAVHEYLADAAASGLTDKKQYGLLLIRQAQSGVPLAFVNHFFQSPLKQRLIMLTRNASPALRAWKYGLVLPVLTMLLLLVRLAPAAAQQKKQNKTDKDIKELTEVDQLPKYPGGEAALLQFLSERIKYPESARRDSAQGMVAVTFIIGTDGSVSHVQKVKPTPAAWRQDFLDEAIRVVGQMPNWEPGRSKGKAVKVRFTLPIRFKLD